MESLYLEGPISSITSALKVVCRKLVKTAFARACLAAPFAEQLVSAMKMSSLTEDTQYISSEAATSASVKHSLCAKEAKELPKCSSRASCKWSAMPYHLHFSTRNLSHTRLPFLLTP